MKRILSGPNCWTIEPPVFCCVPSAIKLEAASKAVLKLSKFRFPNRFNYPSKCLCKRRNLNEPSISSSSRQTLAGRFHTDTFFYFLNLSNHFSYPTITETIVADIPFGRLQKHPECGCHNVDSTVWTTTLVDDHPFAGQRLWPAVYRISKIPFENLHTTIWSGKTHSSTNFFLESKGLEISSSFRSSFYRCRPINLPNSRRST